MPKYNLVLFCKSYRGDIKRIKILKSSIDKFNAEKYDENADASSDSSQENSGDGIDWSLLENNPDIEEE